MKSKKQEQQLSTTLPSKLTPNIYREYFELFDTWNAKYKGRMFLLFLVGSFYEVYGMKKQGVIQSVSNIELMTQICDLNIGEKHHSLSVVPSVHKVDHSLSVVPSTHSDTQTNEGQILFAGFRDYTLDKYLQKIHQAGFTAVVFDQQTIAGVKRKQRSLTEIYSPSTFIQESGKGDIMTNNVMCVWRTGKVREICGISSIDIITGKSYIFENDSEVMSVQWMDELERIISTCNPNEVLIVDDSEESQIRSLFPKRTMIHEWKEHDDDERIKNASKEKYIKTMIDQQFGQRTYQQCSEFQTYSIATQAFCMLLNFCFEHNPKLIEHIQMPVFQNTQDRVVLANHTLKQLNIVNDGENEMSVLKFMNQCQTPMGSRLFSHLLLNPTSNEEKLQKEYSVLEQFGKNEEFSQTTRNVRKILGKICDIEKIIRLWRMDKITPNKIYKLNESLQIIEQLYTCWMEDITLQTYFSERAESVRTTESILTHIQQISSELNNSLNLNYCKTLNDNRCLFQDNVEENNGIITLFVAPQDAMLQEYREIKNEIYDFRNTLQSFILINPNAIKIEKTENNPLKFVVTKIRSVHLAKQLQEKPSAFSPVTFKSTNASQTEIMSPRLQSLSQRLWDLTESIETATQTKFKEWCLRFKQNNCHLFDNIINYVAKMDVFLNRVHLMNKYNYCCPRLWRKEEREGERSEPSCVDAENLRHPLIEQLPLDELYVPNNIGLSESRAGMILFGINSSGKTSLLRSLGIAIILAQSGNPVPATSFKFKPYRAIYSRILGNDNLFKGQSSFTVEMSELRVILNYADDHSLVLADEISKGSEIESAISITTASILHLLEKKTSFMITSHLHKIVEFPEISTAQLQIKHLEVIYNAELDKLEYKRTLQEGAGMRFYGLAVCRSLHMPSSFLDTAHIIRNKYLVDVVAPLSRKESSYHPEKIRGECEECHEKMSEEVHHIIPQKKANAKGFFENGTHKNQLANLKALCGDCHLKQHQRK
jgi:DNA mismatch repair protein MutS